MVQMVRESAETDYLANSRDFMREFEVSRRTVARDLDYLRDEENAPLAYDEARHGYVLTDETYALPPVNISRKEAFSFGLARKLLAHYEGTPLHLDMKAVLDKIAASLEGEVTLEPDWLSEHVDVLPEDRVRIDPDLWGRMVGFIERRECIRTGENPLTACSPTTCSPITGTGTCWRTTRRKTAWRPSRSQGSGRSRGQARRFSGCRTSMPEPMREKPSASQVERISCACGYFSSRNWQCTSWSRTGTPRRPSPGGPMAGWKCGWRPAADKNSSAGCCPGCRMYRCWPR